MENAEHDDIMSADEVLIRLTHIARTSNDKTEQRRALELLARYHNLTGAGTPTDWKEQAVEDIRAGRVTYDALVENFGKGIADELFRRAGVAIPISDEERDRRIIQLFNDAQKRRDAAEQGDD